MRRETMSAPTKPIAAPAAARLSPRRRTIARTRTAYRRSENKCSVMRLRLPVCDRRHLVLCHRLLIQRLGG
jgi:hypothetical protein